MALPSSIELHFKEVSHSKMGVPPSHPYLNNFKYRFFGFSINIHDINYPAIGLPPAESPWQPAPEFSPPLHRAPPGRWGTPSWCRHRRRPGNADGDPLWIKGGWKILVCLLYFYFWVLIGLQWGFNGKMIWSNGWLCHVCRRVTPPIGMIHSSTRILEQFQHHVYVYIIYAYNT